VAASKAAGVRRFIYASTSSVYGVSDASEVTEELPLKPLTDYNKYKGLCEALLLKYQSPEFTTVAIRPATVCGPSPRMRFDLTVNEFTMELLTKRRLTMYGEQFWRPYLHVRDAARAMCQVLEADARVVAGEAFNVGDSRMNYQKGQLVELICAQLGNHAAIERVAQGEDPRDYRVSFAKIQERLGFRTTRTVETGVHEIAQAITQGVITDVGNPCYRNVVN